MDRYAVASRQAGSATDMIVMLMRDQDRIDLTGFHPGLRQAGRDPV
jgi:hypothetical protein